MIFNNTGSVLNQEILDLYYVAKVVKKQKGCFSAIDIIQ